jgi:tetratricopeptide (TPR) repeat protein
MIRISLVITFLFGIFSTVNGQSEPPYGMSELEAYAVFSDAYRTGDYDLAITFGSWILEAKPRAIQGHSSYSLDTQFNRFINIYKSKADESIDPADKTQYLQQVLNIFNEVFETFHEEEFDLFRWKIRHGQFYQEYYRDLDQSLQQAYRIYEEAYKLNGPRFAEMSEGYYARVLLDNYVARGDRDIALALIDEIEPFAGPVLLQTIEDSRNELFQDPGERIVFLEERLDQLEDRESGLKELADLYDRVGDREKVRQTAEELYVINPDYENTRKLADLALSDANYTRALNYLSEALEKAGNNDQRKHIAIEISETFKNTDNLQMAREYARQAINLDNNYGTAYLQVADIYASAVTQCTSESGRSIDRDDRTIYWLVLDYLEQAIDADASVRNTANRRIESYYPVLPSIEDKFFRGWEAGDSFIIGSNIDACYGWINESTTIR